MKTRDEILYAIQEAAQQRLGPIRRGEVLILQVASEHNGANWTAELVELFPDDAEFSGERISLLSDIIDDIRGEHPVID
ncbi:Polymerase I and transcript release factor (Calvin) (cav-p60)-like protein [Ancylobacter novellus DSM 506]|uniref:Polymerase I and transcript release factor (Calvin) (Cav-p60)-like protein n=1 Tax=Ancylobacter novellus (strain ATCC 8093 / DSM 506 / JCM 20403 / CCM 1077 / IAM 12100 / NBRC 12443 / NCIMB 10456) TaxID=639283 RepID=D7A6N0_ANCN5|nr:hypothetical protein [Ancylobacter novellus]ADH90228.1 Polymerase I and transcript release factor (Calvin) (cav-p60)-like protein [Ancylobacter novellus DSM 506]